MNIHPLIEKLKTLRLNGMAESLKLQLKTNGELPFEERLALLIQSEETERENKKLQIRLKKAHLKQNASMEEIDYTFSRGLDKSLLLSLQDCKWITTHRNILITGPTGTGKSYISEALAHNACLKGYIVKQERMPRLFTNLKSAKADGKYLSLLKDLAKCDLLVLDDFGISPLSEESQRDLLEIVEERYDRKSTILTSQLPLEDWHEGIGDKTLADAILDRLVHNAYRVSLKGESFRKHRMTLGKKAFA